TESKIFKSDIKGNFGGVGLEVGVRDNLLTVISPLKNTPAGRSIIKTGDIILKIDDGSTEKLSVDEAVGLIRGEVGTKVKLDILRQNNATTTENFVVTLTRATIDIPTIETEFRSDGIFVIRLFSFSETSSNLFREALRNFVRTGSSKLILDLRGNPGGYLEAAVNMASWFLPPGAVVVQEDYKNDEENVIHRSKGFDIFDEKLKMVILIDGGSASASEILAGALREQNIATLIGTDSFGKGSVQELIEFTSNTSLKITIAQWLTPNGNSISAGGLKPDIEVKPAEKNPGPDNDLQMKAAVEFLLKK
ncbi:MAG: S41 family peptidase, partial [Patescibacteria group bacterium]